MIEMGLQEEAKRRFGKYRKRKYKGGLVSAVAILYFVFIGFHVDYSKIQDVFSGIGKILIELSIVLVFFVIYIIGLLIIQGSGIEIQKILFEECNPYLYEACLRKCRVLWKRDAFTCTLAAAKYYQGDKEQMYHELQSIQVFKLKRTALVNYYSLMSDYYFSHGLQDRVSELEQACARSIGRGKNNQKQYQIFCASNNLRRAMANEDYGAAFQFLMEIKELQGSNGNRLFLVIHHMWEARIYLALGEKESAKVNLDYVVEKGGCLGIVNQAKRLLKTTQI